MQHGRKEQSRARAWPARISPVTRPTNGSRSAARAGPSGSTAPVIAGRTHCGSVVLVTGLPSVVSAVESQSERDDPTRIVSPVYQELQCHESTGNRIDGVCLLLTGHFFQHHFSAAIRLFRDPDSPRDLVLDFDVADRCRSPVQSLAATYLVRLGSSDLAEADPQGIAWNPGTTVPGRLGLRCELTMWAGTGGSRPPGHACAGHGRH